MGQVTSEVHTRYPEEWELPRPADLGSQRPRPRIRAGSTGVEGKPGAPQAGEATGFLGPEAQTSHQGQKGEEKDRIESSDIGCRPSPISSW